MTKPPTTPPAILAAADPGAPIVSQQLAPQTTTADTSNVVDLASKRTSTPVVNSLAKSTPATRARVGNGPVAKALQSAVGNAKNAVDKVRDTVTAAVKKIAAAPEKKAA